MSTEELPVNGMKGSVFIFCADINSRPDAQSRLKVPYAQGKHRLTCRQCAEWNREMIYVNKAQRSWKLDLAVSLKVLCFRLEWHKNIDVMLYVLNQIFSVKNCRYDNHIIWASYGVKPPATRLILQQLDQTNNKNTTFSHDWPFHQSLVYRGVCKDLLRCIGRNLYYKKTNFSFNLNYEWRMSVNVKHNWHKCVWITDLGIRWG